jgi:hypothetical protein
MVLLPMPICSITRDQDRLLGPTPMKRRDSLLKLVKTLREMIKFMIVTVKNAIADFSLITVS